MIRDSRECSLKKEQLEIKIKISAVRFAAKLSIETLPFSKFQDFRVTSQQDIIGTITFLFAGK